MKNDSKKSICKFPVSIILSMYLIEIEKHYKVNTIHQYKRIMCHLAERRSKLIGAVEGKEVCGSGLYILKGD